MLTPHLLASPSGSVDIALQLVVDGTSLVQTRGRKGPAIICGTTESQFRVVTPIQFDIERGFSAGEPQADVEILRQQRHIHTTLPGLRGQLVRNIGQRRMRSQERQIHRLVRDNTRQRIRQNVAHRVDERIAAWNEHWHRLHAALRNQAWYYELPATELRSQSDHLLVLVTPQGHQPDSSIQHSALPTSRPDALAEVLIDQQWLQQQGDAAEIVKLITSATSPLLIVAAVEGTYRVEADAPDGWNRISLVVDSEEE
jgi:hypothetical protein